MDFLYGKHRKVLKIIYKNNSAVNRSELSKKTKFNSIEIDDICRSLHNQGYISFIGNGFKVKITPKGCDYFSSETSISIDTILKSIVCPIIVSLITTLITLWLSK